MAENTPRIIKTPFFSNKAKEVLDSVLGQLSDGIWENSGRMEKYWRFAEVKTAPDNRVYIEIENVSGKPTYDHRWTTNGFFRMSNDEVIQFFASKIKYIMQQELKDDDITNGWRRDNTELKSFYLTHDEDISVADVYMIYDVLRGRTPKSVREDVIGKPLDETKTKNEIARRKIKAKYETEYTATMNALNIQKEAALNEIEAKFVILRKEAHDKYNEQIKGIDAQI